MDKIHYDECFKNQVIKEYYENHLGYKKLAAKYKISRDTIRGWILHEKSTRARNDAVEIIATQELIDITDKVKSNTNVAIANKLGLITFYINGFAISATKDSLLDILEAINDDRFKSN